MKISKHDVLKMVGFVVVSELLIISTILVVEEVKKTKMNTSYLTLANKEGAKKRKIKSNIQIFSGNTIRIENDMFTAKGSKLLNDSSLEASAYPKAEVLSFKNK